MRLPKPKNENTYHELEFTRANSEDGHSFILEYHHRRGEGAVCGLRMSAAGEVLDYGGFAPKNYRLIRAEVNQLATTLFHESTLTRVRIKKQYDGTCQIHFKAGDVSVDLAYTYNRKSHRWSLMDSLQVNPSFPHQALDSVIEIVQTMAQKTYTPQELHNSLEKA